MGSGKVEGGMKCVKWLMWIFNFLFFIVGLALIIIGAVLLVKFKVYFQILGAAFNFAPVAIIVVGIIIFMVAFFGCCGAYRENYCMVMTFAGLMILILILELAAAIAGFIMKAKVKEIVKEPLSDAVKKYDEKDVYKEVIDAIQKTFQCCGSKNSADYKDRKNGYPQSCCKDSTKCDKPPSKDQINTAGCVDKFEDWVAKNILIVAGAALGFCFLQFVGILFACCLGRAIKKEYEVV